MDNISKKNESFLTGELKVLQNINELEICCKDISSLVEQYSDGVLTNVPIINSRLDEASYFKRVIEDTTSAINMYASSVVYSESDFEKSMLATKKNAFIDNVTIPKTVPMKDFIDDFTIDVVNLGFDGVTKGDILYVSMYSIETLVHTETVIPIADNILGLNERGTVTIHGLPCPDSHNQYSMDFIIATNEDVEYASTTIEGINVASQGTLMAEVENDI